MGSTSPSTLIYLSSRSSATFSNRNRFDTGVWLLLERETRPVKKNTREIHPHLQCGWQSNKKKKNGWKKKKKSCLFWWESTNEIDVESDEKREIASKIRWSGWLFLFCSQDSNRPAERKMGLAAAAAGSIELHPSNCCCCALGLSLSLSSLYPSAIICAHTFRCFLVSFFLVLAVQHWCPPALKYDTIQQTNNYQVQAVAGLFFQHAAC